MQIVRGQFRPDRVECLQPVEQDRVLRGWDCARERLVKVMVRIDEAGQDELPPRVELADGRIAMARRGGRMTALFIRPGGSRYCSDRVPARQIGGCAHPDDLRAFQYQRAVCDLLTARVHRYKAGGVGNDCRGWHGLVAGVLWGSIRGCYSAVVGALWEGARHRRTAGNPF